VGRRSGPRAPARTSTSRANDGLSDAGPPFSATPIYTPGTAPGDYQFTPPYDAPPFDPLAVAPGRGNLKTFAFDLSKHEVRRPLRLSNRLYAADLNFVKAIGRIDSTTRTAEQSESQPQAARAPRQLARTPTLCVGVSNVLRS
jgi:hypothetical protein